MYPAPPPEPPSPPRAEACPLGALCGLPVSRQKRCMNQNWTCRHCGESTTIANRDVNDLTRCNGNQLIDEVVAGAALLLGSRSCHRHRRAANHGESDFSDTRGHGELEEPADVHTQPSYTSAPVGRSASEPLQSWSMPSEYVGGTWVDAVVGVVAVFTTECIGIVAVTVCVVVGSTIAVGVNAIVPGVGGAGLVVSSVSSQSFPPWVSTS